MTDKYQLRQAAGMYWLLDMSQKGLEYKKPVCMNETGAYLWELIRNGYSKEMVIKHLCEEFGLNQDEASEDVEGYYNTLLQHGIEI